MVYMKTAVSTYSYAAYVRASKMTIFDVIKKTKELGFDGIEFTDIVSIGDDLLESAEKVKEECAAIGLEIVNYTIGADLLNGSKGSKPEDEVERLKKQVDVAAAMGAPGMRHDATWGPAKEARQWRSFDNYLPMLAEGCRAVAEYAATKNIRTMVENHGYFAQDSDRMEKLVTAVAHPNFGILCDMGNFMCADEDPLLAVARVAPYTFHVHAKDFHIKSGSAPHPGKGFFPTRAGNHLRGAIVGHGEVPVQQCLRIMKNAGYDGFVSIEFEGIEDSLVGVGYGLENLKRYIAAL
jgi:sugar phosphate isomerase/epimerase